MSGRASHRGAREARADLGGYVGIVRTGPLVVGLAATHEPATEIVRR